jgi:hypothetical protein
MSSQMSSILSPFLVRSQYSAISTAYLVSVNGLYQSVALSCATLAQCTIRSGRFPSRFEAKWISKDPGRAADGEEVDLGDGGNPLNQV